jgi:hypothetical protein
MQPKGQDIAQAIRDWTKEEIKSSPSRSYELGRFLFGVSVGTVGIVSAIAKLGQSQSLGLGYRISLISFALSILVALEKARPRNWMLDGKTNLFDEHQRIINRGIRYTVAWFIFWFIAFAVGLYSAMR